MEIKYLSQRAKIAIVIAISGLLLTIVAFGMTGAGFIPQIDFYLDSVLVAESEGFNAIPAGNGISISSNESSGKVDYTFTVTATSTDSFTTITVPDGTNPQASAPNETLTFEAIGLQILGDSGTDTVTFTVTASGIKNITILDPTTGDTNKVQFKYITNSTIVRVSCSTFGGTSVTIQLDERAEGTPNTVGTDIMSSTLACDNNTESTTSFANASIAADAPVNLQITATAGAPDVVRIHIEYTEDN